MELSELGTPGMDEAGLLAKEARLRSTLAGQFNLRHEFITTGELDIPGYRANAPNRCYHCKYELFTHLTRLGSLNEGVQLRPA